MSSKDSFVRYQDQSLHAQVRIPFTRQAVAVRLETPLGWLARLAREDRERMAEMREQDLRAEEQADLEFWEGMRRDGVNVSLSPFAAQYPAIAGPSQAAAEPTAEAEPEAEGSTMTQKAGTRMTTTEPAPVMFRISTIVRLTGLSRSEIYKQIKAGRLRAVKQGSATLITTAALDEYVKLLEREARSGK